MIKGCSKKVIVIKNTGSNIFEEAYFIINPKENGRKYSDFLAEANRIIVSRTGDNRNVRLKKGGVLRAFILVLSGFVVGASSACGIAFLML